MRPEGVKLANILSLYLCLTYEERVLDIHSTSVVWIVGLKARVDEVSSRDEEAFSQVAPYVFMYVDKETITLDPRVFSYAAALVPHSSKASHVSFKEDWVEWRVHIKCYGRLGTGVLMLRGSSTAVDAKGYPARDPLNCDVYGCVTCDLCDVGVAVAGDEVYGSPCDHISFFVETALFFMLNPVREEEQLKLPVHVKALLAKIAQTTLKVLDDRVYETRYGPVEVR